MLTGCDQVSARPPAERAAQRDRLPAELVDLKAEPSDTLRGTAAAGLITPVWIAQDRAGRFVAVDQSDRNIKIYDDRGRATSFIDGGDARAGRFRQLLGGGVLLDSIYGYDFANRRVTVFAATGSPARSLQLPAPPAAPMPVTVRAVDDSLLLVVGFAMGSHRGTLVRLIRPTGEEKSRLFDRRGFYEPLGPALVQRTGVLADARDGVVYAGLLGGDSLFAFDYSGKQIGAGPILTDDGRPIPSFRALMLANGGNAEDADGRPVMDGALALLSIVAVDRHHVVLQVAPLRLSNASALDPFIGGTAIAVLRSPSSGRLVMGARLPFEGALVGRDGAGWPLVARHLTDDGSAVELAHLRLIPQTNDTAAAHDPRDQ